MNHYKVYLTRDAEDDIDAICDSLYQFTCSKRIALNQCERIEKAIEGLKNFPRATQLVDSLTVNGKELRRLSVGKYSILFTVREDEVVVLNVVYSSGSLLNKLLL